MKKINYFKRNSWPKLIFFAMEAPNLQEEVFWPSQIKIGSASHRD
jgi:hypothetical protein